MQPPSVGRIVHYVSHGTPIRGDGTQAFTAQCRAAKITEVGGWVTVESQDISVPGQPAVRQIKQVWDSNLVGLEVSNPSGLFFHPIGMGGCSYDDGSETVGDPNCPERAAHGNPFRYCGCGWNEARYSGGTWHWPERVG